MNNTLYPEALDSFYDPNTTTDTLASVPHNIQHGQVNDAVTALETKLGIGASTPTTNSFFIGNGTGESEWVDTLTNPSITASLLDSNNKTWIAETAVASAVNYAVITNNSTGNAPGIGSGGTDTNIDFNITTKGSGKVRDNGSSLLDFRTSFANFVMNGCIWSATTGLAATMTAGTVWINGIEYSIPAIATHTFGASDDTYVDYLPSTGITYNAVSNNSASYALASGAIRLAIIVGGSSSISSINQGSVAATAPTVSSAVLMVSDSLGNLIYPSDPTSRLLGFRQITSNFTTTTATSYVNVTGVVVPIIAPTNRRLKIFVGAQYYGSSQTAGNGVSADIYDNTATAEVGVTTFTTPVADYFEALQYAIPYSPPAAGARSFQLRVFEAASGTITVGAASTAPAYIYVELE